jgi:hypothetical protein
MNASLWQTSMQPHPMLQALQPWPSHRRELRLYVCAWWRCLSETLHDERLHLLDCVEALAVGEADEAVLSSAIAHLQAAAELDRQGCGNQGLACTWEGLIDALRLEWLPGWETTSGPGGFTGTEEERVALDAESAELDRLPCNLLHEVMGNPFRPTTFEPRW